MSDTLTLIRDVARAEIRRRKRLQREKEEAEADLLAFGRMMWPILEPATPFVPGWPLRTLCDTLMAVTDGHHQKVIINIPPGSGKSLWLNVIWPAWEWGPQDMAHLRYLSASYSQGLPERDNVKFANVINSLEYQRLWGDRVKLVSDGRELVENARTGWKRVTSTRGGTTGHRGDRILIDDANNPKDVESDPVRLSTNQWLTEIMPDRLNNLATGVIVNLQQRTHEDDATGTLSRTWRDFMWLMIPMEYDPLRDTPVVLRYDDDGTSIQTWRDPRGLDEDGNQLEGLYQDENGTLRIRAGSPMAMAEGDLYWPDRIGPIEAADLKATKGAYAWAGQYMQSPTVRGGGIIRQDWWQTWPQPELPDLGTVVAGLDTAIKEGEQNDFNAFQTWGAFELPAWIASAREQAGTPKLILTSAWKMRSSLAELIRRTAESCYERKVDYLVIEDKARGHDVAQEIARQYGDAPWQTVLIPANGRGAFSGDKRARLEAVSAMFSGDVRHVPLPTPQDPKAMMEVWSGGMIYAPYVDWSEEVIEEVCGFPAKAHDDHCFVAGTLIATRRGQVPIEQITLTDEVLTPFGWKKVKYAAPTGIAEVSERQGLVGTDEHPIFTLDRAYQSFQTIANDTLLARLTLCGLIQTLLLKSSSSMGSLIEGWEEGENTTYLNRAAIWAVNARRDYMSPSGRKQTAAWFPRNMKSIIAMAILLISAMTIWSAYRKTSIVVYLRSMVGAKQFFLTSMRFATWRLNGIDRMRDGPGTDSTPKRHSLKGGFRAITYARNVARLLWQRMLPPSIVGQLAHNGPTGIVSTLHFQTENVGGVVRYFPPIAKPAYVAPRSAEWRLVTSSADNATLHIPTTQPVYNLTVEWPHCYYASGILVHNCDVTSMVLSWIRRHGVVVRAVEHQRDELEKRKFRRTPGVPYAVV